MYWMPMDSYYLVLVVPAMLLAMWAQLRVQSAFARYSRMPNSSGISGADAARTVLSRSGIEGVEIREHQGMLSDHYDPSSRVLNLSPDVFHGRSIAAIGIAAHEAGHALQHAEGYALLRARSAIVPLASMGSWLSVVLIIAGIAFHAAGLVQLGIVAFGAVVVFQLVTLPVEFDASARAKRLLVDYGIVRSEEERIGVASVLGAAALTYVAATIVALAQLLRLVMIFGNSRNR